MADNTGRAVVHLAEGELTHEPPGRAADDRANDRPDVPERAPDHRADDRAGLVAELRARLRPRASQLERSRALLHARTTRG